MWDIYFIVWISEGSCYSQKKKKKKLNNTLGKIKAELKASHPLQDPYLAYRHRKHSAEQGRQQGLVSLVSKLIALLHQNPLDTAGWSYFIDRAVTGKTGNKKCSFYKHCCLVTLYFNNPVVQIQHGLSVWDFSTTLRYFEASLHCAMHRVVLHRHAVTGSIGVKTGSQVLLHYPHCHNVWDLQS